MLRIELLEQVNKVDHELSVLKKMLNEQVPADHSAQSYIKYLWEDVGKLYKVLTEK